MAERTISYVTTGGERVLDFDWTVAAATDLVVTRTRAGDAQVLVLGSGYTVDGVGSGEGGAVVMSADALADDRYDITGSEASIAPIGSPSTLADASVTNAKLASMAGLTFKANRSAGAAVPQDVTARQAADMLPLFDVGARGLVPPSGGGAVNYLRADGTWAAPSGGGGGGGGTTYVVGVAVGDVVVSSAPAPASGRIRLGETATAVSAATWPELKDVVEAWGYPWGEDIAGAGTFNVPPAAGYLLRFAGTSGAVDPDGPRAPGSTQGDAVLAHAHGPGTLAGTTGGAGAHDHSIGVHSQGASIGHGGHSQNEPSEAGVNSPSGNCSTTGVNNHVHGFSVTAGNTATAGSGTETRGKNVAFHADMIAAIAGATLAEFDIGADGLVPGPTADDVANNRFLRADGTWQAGGGGGGGGVSDHGALTGLGDDDHPQYHNDARGDARYSALSHNHAGVYDPAGTAAALIASHAAAGDPHPGYLTQAEADALYEALNHTHPASEISDSTVAGRALLTAADAAAQRTALGMATIATSGSASDLSAGTIPAARMPAHTGDVTSSTGAVALTIAPDAVSNDKLANVATATLKGRASAGAGNPEDLTAAQVRTLLNVADGANAYIHPNHSGDVTSTGDGATAIATNAVTSAKISDDAVSNAKLANMATATLKGRATAGAGDPEDLTAAQARTLLNVADGANAYVHPNHTGDVTSTGDGATVIAVGAVTSNKILDGEVGNSKLASVASGTIKGRVTAGTGTLQDLTAAQVRTLLNVADGANAYIHPNHSGDVTSTGDGATAIATNAVTSAKIADDAVSNAKLANMATATLKGRATAGTGDPEDLSGTQATALLDTFTSGAKGLVPASGGGTTNFLRADGAFAAPPGAGGGEANTASNVGATGIGVFKQKTGLDLEFKKISPASGRVNVVDDTANSELDIDVLHNVAANSVIARAAATAGAVSEIALATSQLLGRGSTGDVAAISLLGFIIRGGQLRFPPGFPFPWPIGTPPSWGLELDGASLAVATYPDLHAVLGYDYGGSGANFNLPDWRGEALRGWDHGRGADPDAASRTDRGDGTTGDNVGTKQLGQIESHTHSGAGANGTANGNQGTGGSLARGMGSQITAATGGNETRMRNVNVMWCIAY